MFCLIICQCRDKVIYGLSIFIYRLLVQYYRYLLLKFGYIPCETLKCLFINYSFPKKQKIGVTLCNILLSTRNIVFLDGLLKYIKNNIPTYVDVAYPSAMKSIDKKLEEFVQTVVLQEGENTRFYKAHDIKGTPPSYGKMYYAECRNDGIHLMTKITKGQKAGKSL